MMLSMIAQLVIGAGLTNFRASNNTLVQLFVSDDLRGRVMSTYQLAAVGMTPLGALEVGYMGSHLGPKGTVIICGVITMLSGLVLWTRLIVDRIGTRRPHSLSTWPVEPASCVQYSASILRRIAELALGVIGLEIRKLAFSISHLLHRILSHLRLPKHIKFKGIFPECSLLCASANCSTGRSLYEVLDFQISNSDRDGRRVSRVRACRQLADRSRCIPTSSLRFAT